MDVATATKMSLLTWIFLSLRKRIMNGTMILLWVALSLVFILMIIIVALPHKSRDNLIVLQNDATGNNSNNMCNIPEFTCSDSESDAACYRRARYCCDKGLKVCPPSTISFNDNQEINGYNSIENDSEIPGLNELQTKMDEKDFGELYTVPCASR